MVPFQQLAARITAPPCLSWPPLLRFPGWAAEPLTSGRPRRQLPTRDQISSTSGFRVAPRPCRQTPRLIARPWRSTGMGSYRLQTRNTYEYQAANAPSQRRPTPDMPVQSPKTWNGRPPVATTGHHFDRTERLGTGRLPGCPSNSEHWGSGVFTVTGAGITPGLSDLTSAATDRIGHRLIPHTAAGGCAVRSGRNALDRRRWYAEGFDPGDTEDYGIQRLLGEELWQAGARLGSY